MPATIPITSQNANRRADQAHDERFQRHRPRDLPARRPQRTQQRELLRPLRHDHGERVRDEEGAHQKPHQRKRDEEVADKAQRLADLLGRLLPEVLASLYLQVRPLSFELIDAHLPIQPNHREVLPVSVELRIGVLADQDPQRHLWRQPVVVEPHHLDGVAAILVHRDELLPGFDAVLCGAVCVDQDLANFGWCRTVRDFWDDADGLVVVVVQARPRCAQLHLQRVFVLRGQHKRLFGEDVDAIHFGVVLEFLNSAPVQRSSVFAGADDHVNVVKHCIHCGIEGGREHVREHQRAREERGAQHDSEDGEGKAQLVRRDVAQGNPVECVGH